MQSQSVFREQITKSILDTRRCEPLGTQFGINNDAESSKYEFQKVFVEQQGLFSICHTFRGSSDN